MIYKDGAYLGRTAIFGLGFPFKECCVNEHVFIIRLKKPLNQMFLYFWTTFDETKALIKNLNTNLAQPGLNKEGIMLLRRLVPPEKILDLYYEISLKIVSKVFKNCLVSRTLTQLRDLLLPRLVSGKLRVPDVDKFLRERGL